MPTPTRTPTSVDSDPNAMTFPKAIEAVIAGSKVTKLEWKNPEVYIYLDGDLMIRKEDDTKHSLILSSGDVLGKDWVIVE